MARRIVITSGKGGVGKTTLCANIGGALSRLGAKVLLLDLDFGLNNLDVVLGVESKIVYDILDVITGKCRAKQALIADDKCDKLYILPTFHTFNLNNIDYEQIDKVINEVEYLFDYVIIDCPAGMDNGFARACSIAKEAIVVTTPHISAIRDADKILSMLSYYKMNSVGVVINRVRGDLTITGEMIDIDTIVDFLHTKIYGVVPEDDDISRNLLMGGVVESGEAFEAYNLIAKAIDHGSEVIYDCEKKYKGFWGSIRRKIKRTV